MGKIYIPKLPLEQRFGEKLNNWLEEKSMEGRLEELLIRHPNTVETIGKVIDDLTYPLGDMMYAGGIYWAISGFATNNQAEAATGMLVAGISSLYNYGFTSENSHNSLQPSSNL